MDIINDVSKVAKQLMLKEPFYGVFLSTLNKKVGTTTPTAGVCLNNINYELIVNEEFWNSLDNDNKKIGLLKHELLHICFNHLIDRENYPDHILHNIAADIEINQYIDPQYYPTDQLLLPSSFPELSLPDKMGTKFYYDALNKAKQDGSSPTLDGMLDDDFHSTWGEFESLSEADKKLVKAQIDHQIKSIVESQKDSGRGFVPNELKNYIDGLFEIIPPSYDWRSYFRRFFSSSSKVYTKKTRRKLNKRFQENPALKIKPKKKVLVGVDTSGSVGENDIKEFFNELHHMHKTGVSINVAEGDAKVHKVYEYKGMTPEYITGRGGTNMDIFIDYMNEHHEYNSLIILTDGFIGKRESKSFKPVLTVVSSNGEKLETVIENEWGNVIKINKK